jgi:hypothetical protein
MTPVIANIVWVVGAVVALVAAGVIGSRVRAVLQRRGSRPASATIDRDEIAGRLETEHDAVRLDAEQETARNAARTAQSYRAMP